MEKRRDRDNEWEKDWFINVGPGLPDNESLKCIVYIYVSKEFCPSCYCCFSYCQFAGSRAVGIQNTSFICSTEEYAKWPCIHY